MSLFSDLGLVHCIPACLQAKKSWTYTNFLGLGIKPPIGQVEMGPETGGALIFIY